MAHRASVGFCLYSALPVSAQLAPRPAVIALGLTISQRYFSPVHWTAPYKTHFRFSTVSTKCYLSLSLSGVGEACRLYLSFKMSLGISGQNSILPWLGRDWLRSAVPDSVLGRLETELAMHSRWRARLLTHSSPPSPSLFTYISLISTAHPYEHERLRLFNVSFPISPALFTLI